MACTSTRNEEYKSVIGIHAVLKLLSTWRSSVSVFAVDY